METDKTKDVEQTSTGVKTASVKEENSKVDAVNILKPRKESGDGTFEIEKFNANDDDFENLSPVRYLKNVGKPTIINITNQRKIGWIDKHGNKIKLQVILPNRSASGKEGSSDGVLYKSGGVEIESEETVAKQLGLRSDEKAFFYFDKNNTLIKKEIHPIDKTIRIKNYPHLLDVTYGADGFGGDKRIYTIMMGLIIEIENDNDFEKLTKDYGFLIEVDRAGNVIMNKRSKVIQQWAAGKANQEVDLSKYDERRITPASSNDSFPRKSPENDEKSILKNNETLDKTLE